MAEGAVRRAVRGPAPGRTAEDADGPLPAGPNGRTCRRRPRSSTIRREDEASAAGSAAQAGSAGRPKRPRPAARRRSRSPARAPTHTPVPVTHGRQRASANRPHAPRRRRPARGGGRRRRRAVARPDPGRGRAPGVAAPRGVRRHHRGDRPAPPADGRHGVRGDGLRGAFGHPDDRRGGGGLRQHRGLAGGGGVLHRHRLRQDGARRTHRVPLHARPRPAQPRAGLRHRRHRPRPRPPPSPATPPAAAGSSTRSSGRCASRSAATRPRAPRAG